MLNRVAMRAKICQMLTSNNQVFNMARMAANRGIHTVKSKSYVVPEGVNDVINYLDDRRPTYTCLYFHAAWNPICANIDKDYDNFCSNNAEF